MTAQFLQFVREELKTATADLSGATKGQLVAFAENAMFSATARSRGRKKIIDTTTGRMVKPDGPPMNGSQSRAKGSSIALVSPVEFGTASWRRAVLSLAEHQKAWLLWNYSENIRFEYQVVITQWAWAEFRGQFAAKKMAGKTMERLKTLIWLAAQDVKAELAGRDTYEYKQLAELIGVTPKNWSETFTARWEQMKGIFKGMDSDALLQVTRSRSLQKAANFAQSLAKLD
ncbi:antiterminator-like protein [Cronobacter dublinensis 1210]|uniref:Antiterminator-like protein n=1 Tax=Cronobacter dublinensis 1210 TaxID=1208656 RepID=A0ABM9QCZ4_9ENTR|nr:bacteriophage antitermination protein Q [Cronobacter dublinensis]ALB67172.1 antiterminator [Cronobacter dublinensis subsp. dublinensis LMG 23823]MDI7270783.1 bacteriophage antitermination protein Q [Cronobacter dublinensis]CCJ83506.1 antiterminator-like protein [Cronobacter dublinensis 1210]